MKLIEDWFTKGANNSSEGLKNMLLNSLALLLHMTVIVSFSAALKSVMEYVEVHENLFWWHTKEMISELLRVGL